MIQIFEGGSGFFNGAKKKAAPFMEDEEMGTQVFDEGQEMGADDDGGAP